MRVTSELADGAILAALGERLSRQRIEAHLTQAELAERAGIGKRTLERLERGHGGALITLIRVLRVLNLVEGLEQLIPKLPPSPLEQLELRGKERQRVSHLNRERRVGKGGRKPWTWSDD